VEAEIRTELVINGRFLTQSVTGVQRYARELLGALDGLAAQCPEVTVRLLTPPMASAGIPLLRHIRHESVGHRQGHAWEQLDLPRHVGSGTLFCPGNTAPVLSLLGRTRVVVTVHDLSYLYFPKAYSRSFRLLYHRLIPLIMRRADRVITVSQSERRAILEYYPFADERLIAIQNGGLPVGIEAQSSRATDKPMILYVGSLSKRKNFPGMLDAAIRLARRDGTRFTFIGGLPAGLNSTLADIPADIREHIRFLGQVDDWPTLLEAYRSASCLLFPSFYEASPLPPIEAMGCGCPVIAGDISSLRERCGDAALYCDPHNVDSIVAAVERLLGDRQLQAKLREAGYRQASEYSWQHCARRTLDILVEQDEAA
jgi:glycosyltransferase involved in cell wall biosynthesis